MATKKHSLIKWIAKGARLLWGVVVVTFGLAGVACVVFYFWITTGELADKAASLFEYSTGGGATIGSVTISPTGFLYAKECKFRFPEGEKFSFDSFQFDPDFSSLLDGVVVIRKVALINPSITTAQPSPGKKEKISEHKPSSSIDKFFFPMLALDLRSVTIKGLIVTVLGDVNEKVVVKGINLDATAKIKNGVPTASAKLYVSESGAIDIDRLDISARIKPFGGVTATFESDGSFSVDLDMRMTGQNKKGDSILSAGSTLAIDLHAAGVAIPYLKATVTGSAKQDENLLFNLDAAFTENKEALLYQAKLSRVEADLNSIIKSFGISGIKAEGIATISALTVAGNIGKNGGSAVRMVGTGNVKLEKFATGGLSAPSGGRIDFNLEELTYDGVHIGGAGSIAIKAPLVEMDGTQFGDVAIEVFGSKKETRRSEESFTITYQAGSVKHNEVDFGRFSGSLDAVGDFAVGNLSEVTLTLASSDGVKAKLVGAIKGYGKKNLSVKVEVEASLVKGKDFGLIDKLPFTAEEGSFSARADIDGFLGEDFIKPRLRFDIDGKIESDSFDFAELGVKITRSDIGFKAKGKLNPLWFVTDLLAELTATAGSAHLEDSVDIGATKIHLSIDSPEPVNDKMTISAALFAEQVTPIDKSIPPTPVTFRLTYFSDPVTGVTRLRNLKADFGENGVLSAPFVELDAQGRFTGTLEAKKLDLAFLFALAPDAARKSAGLTAVAGALTFNLSSEGSVDIEKQTDWYPFPVSLDGNIELDNGRLISKTLGLEIKGAEFALKVVAGGERANLTGGVWIERLLYKDVFGDREVDPSIEFDISIAEEGTLNVERLVVDTTSLGLVSYLEGSIKSLPFDNMDQWASRPGVILADIDADINSFLLISLDERQKFFEALDVVGQVEVETVITARKGKMVSVKGVTELKNLTVLKGGEVLVRNAVGKIPFSKTLRYIYITKSIAGGEKIETPPSATPAIPALPSPVDVRDTTFFNDIRAAAGQVTDQFIIDLINAGPVRLGNTAFDIYLKEERFGVDYFRTNLLGGGLSGSFAIKSEKEEYQLRTSIIFAELDIEQALGRDLGLEEKETGLDGTATLAVNLTSGDNLETLDLAKIDLAIYLTRIDAKALSKLLLFLDPEESSPAIMNARTALRFAKPSRVELLARRGVLSLNIDLQYSLLLGGQKVRMPVIKRAQIESLTRFGTIKEALNRLSFLNKVMLIVGATQILIDENGAITLR